MLKCKTKYKDTTFNIDGSANVTFTISKAEAIAFRNSIAEKQKGNEPLVLSLEVKKYRKKRSLNANAYFHLLTDKLSKALRVSSDEMKRKLVLDNGEIMKDEQGAKVGFKLPISVDVNLIYKYAKWFKEVTENGKQFNCYIIYKETHDMTTKEMAVLIDGTIVECSAVGIETKTPEEIAKMLAMEER